METVICQKCGTPHDKGAKFCRNCGAALGEPLTELESWAIAARNGNGRAMEFVCERIADDLLRAARSVESFGFGTPYTHDSENGVSASGLILDGNGSALLPPLKVPLMGVVMRIDEVHPL